MSARAKDARAEDPFRHPRAAFRRWGIRFVPPAQQFQDAIKDLNPAPKHHARCECEVVRALCCVYMGRTLDATGIPNETFRKMCNRVVKATRTIEAFWARVPLTVTDPFTCEPVDVESFLKELRKYRGIVEHDVTDLGKKAGAKSRSQARRCAVDCAHRLLCNFDEPPKLSHEGRWQTLARILYGDETVDLYKYMQTSIRPTALLFDVGLGDEGFFDMGPEFVALAETTLQSDGSTDWLTQPASPHK